MSKLWMTVWMLGEIHGVAGPVPYDATECMTRAAEATAQIAAQIATGTDVEGNPVTDEARTLRWQCVEQVERPVMGGTTPLQSPLPTGDA